MFQKQVNLTDEIDKFYKSTKSKNPDKKKYWLMKTHTDFLKEDKTILIVLKVKYFQSENRNIEK